MTARLRRTITWACLIVTLVIAPAQGFEIARQVETKLRSANLGPTRVGIFIMDLDHSRVLAQISPDDRLIPASNMKLITTASALINLGPEFLFKTELHYLTQQNNTHVLVIKGDGDPAFGDPVILKQHGMDVDDILDLWIEAIKKTGQTHFDRLVVDDRVFDRTFTHTSWPKDELLSRSYAPVAGLNFYQNLLDVLPQPTRTGQAPMVSLYPREAADFLITSNQALTGRSETFWVLRGKEGEMTFRGIVKNKRTVPVQVSLEDPPIFLARVLHARLAREGITVNAIVRAEEDEQLAEGRVLHRLQTTLPLVIERTNRNSQNMFAESLLKRMGRNITGRPGSFENGAAAMRIAMQKLIGPRVSVLNIADGSGLSRDNQATARFFVELLRAMHQYPDKEIAEIFQMSLAVGGVNGTLRKRFRNLDPNFTVLAKSGSLTGVSTLSGYIKMPINGGTEVRTIAFSLLFNNYQSHHGSYNIRKLQEEIIGLIVQAMKNEQAIQLGG